MPEGTSPSSMCVLFAGMGWPPQTFLARLIDGLLNTGVHVTAGVSQRPYDIWLEHPGFSWLPVPKWEGTLPMRLLKLSIAYGRALKISPSDLKLLRPYIQKQKGLVAKARLLQGLIPFIGRRGEVLYFPWNSGAIERLALFDLGMPVVISCRGAQVNVAPYQPDANEYIKGLQQTFQKAAIVHCVCRDIFMEAQKFGLKPEKAMIIHPAVDPDFFIPTQDRCRADRVLRIISTGSLIWRKGYEYALLSILQLKHAGIPVLFQIIGDGPDRQRLLYTIQDLALDEQVQLLGRLAPDSVRQNLRQADVFLLSSLSEGIANAALEAMACGLPVVTTDCGGMREAVNDGVEGFVVPVRDPHAATQALQTLYQDTHLRQSFGNAARHRVLTDFSLERQVSRFTELFRMAKSEKQKSYSFING